MKHQGKAIRADSSKSWRLNTILCGCWVFFILAASLYANYFDGELHQLTGRLWMLGAGVLLFTPLFMRWLRDRKFRSHQLGEGLPDWAFRLICFGCAMAVLGFCFLAYNPGGFDGDPRYQLEQALSGNYNDQTPALHTILVFWLPMTLTGGWFPSIILFQILLFSAALTYVCDTVRKYADTFWALVSLILIVMNPITQSYLLYAYKDNTFGICAMVLVCMNARILFSHGEWMKKPLHLAAFSVMLALISIVRHNGFLFALPCAAGAALCMDWRRSLAVLGAALTLFAGIKGPLYSALGVERAEDRSNQTSGLPMSVIGAAVKYCPEKLDDELLEFAYEVAPQEVWEESYTYGIYNWVAWDERFNLQAVEDAGTFGRFALMFRAMQEAPRVCLKALIETTDITYGIVPDQITDGAVYLSAEDLGMQDDGIPWIRSVVDAWRSLTYHLMPHAYLHSGITLLLLLVFGLARLPLNQWNSWKRIIPVLSVFAYNLVTMLVLFSWWDGTRFFHYSIWVLPVLLVILLHRDESSEK